METSANGSCGAHRVLKRNFARSKRMGLNAKLVSMFVAVLVSSCASPSPAPEPIDIGGIKSQIGIASWYGASLHGQITANGETFDQNLLSAAHRTWPMPSLVQVTNLENGKQTIVRVNDRGPFAKDRLIDLSRAAARALGFEQDGHTRVEIRYLGPAPVSGKKAS